MCCCSQRVERHRNNIILSGVAPVGGISDAEISVKLTLQLNLQLADTFGEK